MAAIDKIYLNSWKEYSMFKEWVEKQPLLTDKYGKSVSITKYLYKYSKDNWKNGRPVFQAPYYVDAYLIKNCPFDFVQKELMLNYGHWSQEKINEAYDIVTNRTEKNKDLFYYNWLSEDDFKVIDGIITMPNLEKSDYEKMKDGELFNTPFTSREVTYGTHFKCVKHPIYYYNRPYGCKNWFIDIMLPEGFMWYHKVHNSWDFSDEFVSSDWSSSTAFVGTIKALKRLMIKKWRLPVGTKVRATGRYIEDTYEFLITK